VDGTGIQPIGDEKLAQKIRARVNEFNKEGLVMAFAITGAYVVLPELARLALGGQ
jgi:hypothetical protein